MRTLISSLFLFATIGCASTQSTPDSTPESPPQTPPTQSAAFLNDRCPMMPDAGVDGVTTAEFRGQQIGFCCSDCLGEWQRMSDDDRAARLRAVGH